MQLTLKNDLPFGAVTVNHQGETVTVPDVLVDTGSATTIFSADRMALVQIVPSPEDLLFTIRGVGGTEVVFTRTMLALQQVRTCYRRNFLLWRGLDEKFLC